MKGVALMKCASILMFALLPVAVNAQAQWQFRLTPYAWLAGYEGNFATLPGSLPAYAKGAPMGGAVSKAPHGTSPTFLVAALKDPIGANLDRYQIIKDWMDVKGKLHEKVYDVVWGGDRKPGKDGKLPPVGNCVNVKEATWTPSIGAAELIKVWRDPEFDPKQETSYYGRYIEIPAPR